MDRKEFFDQAWRMLLGKAAETVLENPLVNALEKLAEPPLQPRQRPPGACPSDIQFQSLCTGCDQCMIACPVDIVMIEDLEKRYPVIFPKQAPCLHCSGYPCIQACPTGALRLENGTDLREI